MHFVLDTKLQDMKKTERLAIMRIKYKTVQTDR